MTFNTISTYRHCSRCHSELTDPASQECGIGPICRKKNNSLYARTISANLPVASALILGTEKAMFHPDIQSRFEKFKKSFMRKFQKAEAVTDSGAALEFSGVDFRNEIKDIDFFLSYRNSPGMRDRLIKIVEALGYVGLASILLGRASKSKAKVWFLEGRVYLQGTSCKYGWRAMREIRGIKTPRYRGDKTPYSAPASQYEKFLSNVRKYWPMYDVELEDIAKEAESWVTANLVAQALPRETPEPVKNNTPQDASVENKTQLTSPCGLVERTNDFALSFAWDNAKNMYGFIKQLKKVSYKDRRYEPKSKTWFFKNKHKDTILSVLKEYAWEPQVTQEDFEYRKGFYKG